MAKPKKKKNISNTQPTIITFDILNTINMDDEYELKMLSFCIAYNDLWHINKEILMRSSKKYTSYRLYLLKHEIAQLREAYWLLHKSFLCNKSISEKLCNIEGAYSLFENILNRVDGPNKDSFANQVLSQSRNMTWHYESKDKTDKGKFKHTAEEMNAHGVLGKIFIGNNTANTYFEFADALLINSIVTLGEQYGLNEQEYFNKLGYLTADIIKLLGLIISDFLSSKEEIQRLVQIINK